MDDRRWRRMPPKIRALIGDTQLPPARAVWPYADLPEQLSVSKSRALDPDLLRAVLRAPRPLIDHGGVSRSDRATMREPRVGEKRLAVDGESERPVVPFTAHALPAEAVIACDLFDISYILRQTEVLVPLVHALCPRAISPSSGFSYRWGAEKKPQSLARGSQTLKANCGSCKGLQYYPLRRLAETAMESFARGSVR